MKGTPHYPAASLRCESLRSDESPAADITKLRETYVMGEPLRGDRR